MNSTEKKIVEKLNKAIFDLQKKMLDVNRQDKISVNEIFVYAKLAAMVGGIRYAIDIIQKR